jgi:glycosyltransferase involved in cell wall biosynthesis
VIVPCYNTAPYVAETLASIFAQTYLDFEVVVVNDGSPDTEELERAVAPWMEKVVYLKTENQGLAGARNNGIRASRGEFLALLDSDDCWEPTFLEVLVHELDTQPSLDIVYPRVVSLERPEEPSRPTNTTCAEITFASLIEEKSCVAVSVLARRVAFERVGLFDSNLRRSEDFDMWLRCVKSGSRIAFCDKAAFRYRRRPDSLSANHAKMCAAACQVLEKMRTAVQMTDEERQILENAVRRFKGRQLFFEGKDAFVTGDYVTAIDAFKRADAFLNSRRLRLICVLLVVMPETSRTFYLWTVRRRNSRSRTREVTKPSLSCSP